MKTKIKYISFIILLLFASCENRDWDNPYDPDCPKELFTPSNFKAVQQDSVINLSWEQLNMNISGFLIERSTDGTSWTNLSNLSKSENTSSDKNIIGGQKYTYRLSAKAGNNLSNYITVEITSMFASSVLTNPLSNLTTTSAVLGGEIASDGGAAVTARGVCWNTSTNPTIQNSKTSDGTGTGTFESTLSGLVANTTYYARAYSTNSIGTSYGNQVIFKTYYGEVTDIDGNIYPTVKIGEQIWMAENLKVTKYSDGASMPNVTGNTEWSTTKTGGYRWYGNSTEVNHTYGALYNWYAVNSHKLAPTGWHIPTDDEWKQMEMTLGMSQAEVGNVNWRGTNQGNPLKTTSGWDINNGTNTTSFSAVPGGYAGMDGSFGSGGLGGIWWTSTESSQTTAINRQLDSSFGGIGRADNAKKGDGLSVRCVMGEASKPTVTTSAPSGILANSAVLGGEVLIEGNTSITERGIVYATTQNPTTANTKVTMGNNTGSFGSKVTGLTANTTYYFRAYAISGQGTSYGDEITFTTYFGEVTDIDGNVYPTVKIGEQIWMAENLKVTKYNDGAAIQNITDNSTWAGLATGAYCWYNNNINQKNIYGALYNFYAVSTGRLAPEGWHVATDEDWNILTSYVGGENIAGGELKETGTAHWISPNTGATNSVQFTALPGGNRAEDPLIYSQMGSGAFFWTSSNYNETEAWHRKTLINLSNLTRVPYPKYSGFCVRCVLGEIKTLPTVNTDVPTDVSTNSAVVGGEVINDGNATVTEKGVVFATTQNPTTANTKVAIGSGTGSFSNTVSGLTANTTYYLRAYAINSQGTGYGNEVSFTTQDSFSVGQSYQGGIIAYILVEGDFGYSETVTHGLIAAPSDQSTGITWGNSSLVTGTTGGSIGYGSSNTDLIVSYIGDGNYAAKLCSDLVLGGYSDWYLPSINELKKLFTNKNAIGGFSNNYYWTSTRYEANTGMAAIISFIGGENVYVYSSSTNYVRAVRSF